MTPFERPVFALARGEELRPPAPVTREFTVGDEVAVLVHRIGGWRYLVTRVTAVPMEGRYEVDGVTTRGELPGLPAGALVSATDVEAWEKSGRVPWFHQGPDTGEEADALREAA